EFPGRVMRVRLACSVLVIALVCFGTRARAQEVSPKALTVEQEQEFDRWIKAETEWRQWIEKHRNRAESNWMGMTGRNWLGMATDRKERPVPPAWLDEYCNSLT